VAYFKIHVVSYSYHSN